MANIHRHATTTTLAIENISVPIKSYRVPLRPQSHCPTSLATTDLLPGSTVLPFPESDINEMINYVVFCAWISSCITMFLRFFMLLLRPEVHSFSLLSSTPACAFATICLSVPLSRDIWDMSNLGPVKRKKKNKTLWSL